MAEQSPRGQRADGVGGISYSCDEGDCRDCGYAGCDHFCHLNQEYQFPYGWRIREGYDQGSSDG